MFTLNIDRMSYAQKNEAKEEEEDNLNVLSEAVSCDSSPKCLMWKMMKIK